MSPTTNGVNIGGINNNNVENHNRQSHDGSSSSRPSNERLLCTAFISFCSFAVIQTFVAVVIADSEAMVADSAAMMVDALTYLFNWYAERQKQIYKIKLEGQEESSNNNNTNHVSPTTSSVLLYRKYTLQLEIIPPLLSVSTLLMVTFIVFKEAIEVLILDIKLHQDESLQTDPNIRIMMIFSVFNLFLDILNMSCFASAKHALGYETTIKGEDDDHSTSKDRQQVETMRSLLDDHDHTISSTLATLVEEEDKEDDNDETNDYSNNVEKKGAAINGIEDIQQRYDVEERSSSTESKTRKIGNTKKNNKMVHFEIDSCDNHNNTNHRHHANEDGSNLNMCSAYTHVFADTLRSIAVILASVLATFVPSITSEEADAGAAVIVSILIALSLIPLFLGMIQTIQSLRRVNVLIEEEGLVTRMQPQP